MANSIINAFMSSNVTTANVTPSGEFSTYISTAYGYDVTKVGRICILRCAIGLKASQESAGWLEIGTLPSGYESIYNRSKNCATKSGVKQIRVDGNKMYYNRLTAAQDGDILSDQLVYIAE